MSSESVAFINEQFGSIREHILPAQNRDQSFDYFLWIDCRCGHRSLILSFVLLLSVSVGDCGEPLSVEIHKEAQCLRIAAQLFEAFTEVVPAIEEDHQPLYRAREFDRPQS